MVIEKVFWWNHSEIWNTILIEFTRPPSEFPCIPIIVKILVVYTNVVVSRRRKSLNKFEQRGG